MTLLEPRRTFDVPLTIGVISDTHIYESGARQVPEQVFDIFRRAKVGLILHLGDINTRFVLEELGEIAPVLAVSGNNDDDELYEILPERITFRVGKHTFAMVHGHGGRSARQVVTDEFAGKVDVAFFGHSHIPFMEDVGGTTLFNPGSATDRRWHQHFGVGIVRVTESLVDPELILFANAQHLVNITFDE
jgi:putative phosphoesterase